MRPGPSTECFCNNPTLSDAECKRWASGRNYLSRVSHHLVVPLVSKISLVFGLQPVARIRDSMSGRLGSALKLLEAVTNFFRYLIITIV